MPPSHSLSVTGNYDIMLYEAFLTAFEKLPDQVTEFELDAWYSLADHITVYGRKDIRVTFKNGQEICAYD